MTEHISAQQKLTAHGGYTWLLDGPDLWSVTMVVKALAEAGMPVNSITVNKWFHGLPHVQDFGGNIGMRAGKSDLIEFFAGRMK